MLISLTVLSILGIAFLIRSVQKFLPFAICPICVGVFLTWTGLIGLRFAGYGIDPIVPAVLMGGSVVGIAYQLEKRFSAVSPEARMLWKILFMPAGFVAMYAVLEELWIVGIVALIFLVAISAALALRAGALRRGGKTHTLERAMEECC